MTKDTIISGSHHGEWWINTWRAQGQKNNQILVPVILYMDDISIDIHQTLSINPLNMILSIFNTATSRQQPEA